MSLRQQRKQILLVGLAEKVVLGFVHLFLGQVVHDIVEIFVLDVLHGIRWEDPHTVRRVATAHIAAAHG